jgi:hypothetical protein
MATLFDSASLALIPSGVKDGKVYSIKPTDGSGDFTFSRGTGTATRVNASGLIEKERSNLLLQSNTFSTTWVTTNASVTGGQSGYDGSSDAWLLDASAASGAVFQSIVQSGVLTTSIYAKKGTADGIRIRIDQTTDTNVYVDLTDGSVSSSGNTIDIDVQNVGGGWYRITFAFVGSGMTTFIIYPTDGGTTSIAGTIYIQDAQLEQGLVATDYIETTTAAVYEGITDNLPRLDYSGGASCPSLLLEPSRTNYLVHSEYISGWINAGGTSSQNSQDSTSPEGVYNAAVIDASSGVYLTIGASSNPHTFSVYAKAKSGSVVGLRIDTPITNITNFDLSNGTIQSTGSGHTASIEDAGNGWYRCIISFTDAIVNAVLQSTASGSVYVWGAQLEDNLYPTSYIPTYGTSASRAGDVCSKTGVSDLIGQTEGTMYWEGIFQNEANPFLMEIRKGAANYLRSIYLEYVGGVIRARAFDEGVAQVTISSGAVSVGTHYKVALAYANNDFNLYVNGVLVGSDTSGSVQSGLSDVFIGNLDGTTNPAFIATECKQSLLFKTRLTNAELAALTTIA